MARNIANGATGKISYGNSSNLKILGDLSIGIWAKFRSGSAAGSVIVQRSKDDEVEASNATIYLDTQGSSNAWDIRYIHEYGAGTNETTTFDTNLLDGHWYYIGISRNITAKTVKLYLGDGYKVRLFETYTYTNQPTGGTDVNCYLTLFSKYEGTAQLDDASLSFFTYHSRALSEAEHQAQMQGTVSSDSLLINAPDLLDDLSPGNYDGTATGTTLVADPNILKDALLLESFDNPAYSVPADLVTGGKWSSQTGIALGATYAHYGANGVQFDYGDSLLSEEFSLRQNPIIVGFWMNIDTHATASDVTVLKFYSYLDQTWSPLQVRLSKNVSNQLVFNVNSGFGNEDCTYVFSTDTWYHVTIEVLFSQTVGYYKIYVNGLLVDSHSDIDTVENGDIYARHIIFGSMDNTGVTWWLDSLFVTNDINSIPFSLDIYWNGTKDAFLTWANPEVSDSNEANWDDSVSLRLTHYINITDSNGSNWLDELFILWPLETNLSDSLNSYYDEAKANTIIYQDPQSKSFSDNLNFYGDISYIFIDSDILYELSSSFSLDDSIKVLANIYLEVDDDLNSWQEEVIHLAGELVDISADSMMYSWGDAILTDFRAWRLKSDSFALTDAVQTSLASVWIFRSVTDSFSLSDAVLVRHVGNKQVKDSFSLHDSIKLNSSGVKLLSDTLNLSDSVLVSIGEKEISPTESLELWQDLAQASLMDKLTVATSDNLANWNDESSKSKDRTYISTDYLRRYLNDVIK